MEEVLQLIQRKRRLMLPSLTLALLFYFLLPLSLIFIPEIMNKPSFVMGLPWAWLYAFLQIPMTWFFCGFYHKQSSKIERKMEEIEKEEGS